MSQDQLCMSFEVWDHVRGAIRILPAMCFLLARSLDTRQSPSLKFIVSCYTDHHFTSLVDSFFHCFNTT